MTEYEKLSLQLLIAIAGGIEVQLINHNSENEHAKHVGQTVAWQKKTHSLMQLVSDAVVKPDA